MLLEAHPHIFAQEDVVDGCRQIQFMAFLLSLLGEGEAHGLRSVYSLLLKPWVFIRPTAFFVTNHGSGKRADIMNIVLVGYRCSGKSSVGKAVARRLGMGFVDIDSVIEERAGRCIKEIVDMEGWPWFREMEKRAVCEAAAMDNVVISTGGGAVTDKGNMDALKRNGWLAWLKAGSQVLKERMVSQSGCDGKRPTLTGRDPLDEIDEAMRQRAALYQGAADVTVDTDHLTIQQAAEVVMERARGNLERMKDKG